MDGRGTYRFADGSVYVGEYKGGKREGRGVYRFADGAVYEGEYKQGAMEGFGTYQYVDGRAEVGRYQGNIDVGEGVRWSADRSTAWRLNDGKVVEEVRSSPRAQSNARCAAHACWRAVRACPSVITHASLSCTAPDLPRECRSHCAQAW
jgi:hypothetical protein